MQWRRNVRPSGPTVPRRRLQRLVSRLRGRLLDRHTVLKTLHNLCSIIDPSLRHASPCVQILEWPPAAALKRVPGETSGGIAVAAQDRRAQATTTGASDFQTACETMEAIDLGCPR